MAWTFYWLSFTGAKPNQLLFLPQTNPLLFIMQTCLRTLLYIVFCKKKGMHEQEHTWPQSLHVYNIRCWRCNKSWLNHDLYGATVWITEVQRQLYMYQYTKQYQYTWHPNMQKCVCVYFMFWTTLFFMFQYCDTLPTMFWDA